jgi:glycosyltransferase involved in cell wall biosynthesis
MDLNHRPSVLIVLPVYNEERTLRKSVFTLTHFLRRHGKYKWKIIIADNNSIDGTGDIGRVMAEQNPIIEYLHVPQKGKGIAIRAAWEQADCDIVNYMDIDLSTSLKALIQSIDRLKEGSDLVVANRLDKESVVKRSLTRDIVSRFYNMIIRTALRTSFHDAHCGFNTVRREVAQEVLPYIEDNGFFFAAEFLFYCEKLGFKITEIPAIWTEDLNTKANILKDAYHDLCGIYRLRFHNKLYVKREERVS